MSRSEAPLVRLVRYSRRHRRRLAAASACSILNKVFDLAPPLLIGAAVDVVVKRQGSLIASYGIQDPSAQLLVLVVLTLVIFALESAFEYGYAVLWRNLAQTIQHELRLDTYGHVQRLDLSYFEDRSTGNLLAILNDDINQLERFLDGGANELLQIATTVVMIGGIFFYLAPQVAWLAFLPIPIIIWGSLRFQRRLTPRYAAVRERVGLLSSTLANNLGGIATIKSFTAEAYEEKRLGAVSEEYRLANQGAIALSSAFSPLIRMVIVVGFFLTLFLGGKSALEGTLGVGAFSVMVFMTQRLLWPLTRLGQTIDLYQRAMASTTRILDLLFTPIRVRSGDRPLPASKVRGEITLRDVNYAYRDGTPVIRGISLSIAPGRTVAIVGPTGAGKSTLVKLLLRFYEPQRGSILLDGRDLRTIRLEDLRRAIGLVSQDVFLFHGSVRENIVYGSFDASGEAIVDAARSAEAHEFIAGLPEAYDTIVGERGQKLSGGQRQRISIARAILKDPPILVFDEATSSVDNETEAAIQRSLARIAQGRTTILIAHRLSTIRHADWIYVLDEGVVTEQGTHEALLSAGGQYAALWRVQTGESERPGSGGHPAGESPREATGRAALPGTHWAAHRDARE